MISVGVLYVVGLEKIRLTGWEAGIVRRALAGTPVALP